ncbi:MAG: Fe-S-containing hydro-lyase [Treponema sp.]|jgi:fumarate hydratase subunit beta|nr:Fe-S-containing hydro-lyase [Treponema sp.]
MEHRITLPLTREKAALLHAGDLLFLHGTIYTARDAAHQRLIRLLERGEPLPFPLKDGIIYYVGPSPARPGRIIGAAGPTTSSRMDTYTPPLLSLGLRGMIGKGTRSQAVVQKMQETGALYLGAIGGAGALLADCIKAVQIIAFADLGTEAVHCLTVQDFPTVVIIDSQGNNLYQIGRAAYVNRFTAAPQKPLR